MGCSEDIMPEQISTEFSTVAELPDDARDALIQLADVESNLEFEHIEVCTTPLGINIVVDLAWEESRGSGKSRHTVTCHRTVVCFHRPASKLPRFHVAHDVGFLSSWTRGVPEDVGDGVVDIRMRPEFSQRYTISSPAPKSTSTLFGDEVLDALEAAEGLEAQSSHDGLIAWRDDERLDGESRAQLVEDAVTIFAPIVDDALAGQRAADAVSGTYAQEAVDRWEEEGTKLSRAMLAKIITRAQVDAMALEQPPRLVPRSIYKRALGMSGGLLSLGIIVTVIGTAISALMLIQEYAVEQKTGFSSGLFLLLAPLAGAVILFFTIRWRRRRQRLLTQGHFVPARLLRIETMSLKEGLEDSYEGVFEPKGYSHIEVTQDLEDEAVRISQRVLDAGGGTTLLIDPNDPEVALWLEGWVLENIPD